MDCQELLFDYFCDTLDKTIAQLKSEVNASLANSSLHSHSRAVAACLGNVRPNK